ncbi:MAG: hypothetical protein QM703_11145 [Gemmatales bacterium]
MPNEAEALRQEYLADMREELAQNGPGTVGCHELLDRTSVISDQIDAFLLCHPACVGNPKWFNMAHEAMTILSDLYMAVESVHLTADDKPEERNGHRKR